MNALAASGLLLLWAIAMLIVANRAIWWGLKQGRTPVQCVGLSALSLAFFYATILILLRVVFQQDLVTEWRQAFEASLTASSAVYLEMGWHEEEIKRAIELIRLVFMHGAAGWTVNFCIGFSLISYLIMRRIYPALPGSAITLPSFAFWKAPEKSVWFLLGTMGAIVIGTRTQGWVAWLGLNSTIVLSALYLFIGLAVAMFFMGKRKVPAFLKIMLVVALGFFPALMIFIIVIGVFDTWWDWRRLRRIA